ncbi:hypothetical protein EDD16DRAFT_1550938 [Pisolithus croceorrhizus]|nr:hypothetical protein EDD16DRAFT_1550938 [Pisolithus croceorrhizus]
MPHCTYVPYFFSTGSKFAVSKVTFECAIRSTWVSNKWIAGFLDGTTTFTLAFGLYAFILLLIHMIHAEDLLKGHCKTARDRSCRNQPFPPVSQVVGGGLRHISNARSWASHNEPSQFGHKSGSTHNHQGRHAELPLGCIDGMRDVNSIIEVLSNDARWISIRNYSLIRWDKVLFVRGVQSGHHQLAGRGLHPRIGMESEHI